MRALAPALALALALALVAVPFAAADDEVFSHRVHVAGRVLDVDGLPVAGQSVVLTFTGGDAGGGCFDTTDKPTSAQGDFHLCRHVHAINGTLRVRVRVLDAEATRPVDTVGRHAFVQLQLAGARPARDVVGDRVFNDTFAVRVRAYELFAAPSTIDGIVVPGAPLVGSNALARLVGEEGTLAERPGVVDEMGDAAIDLSVGDLPADARVVVRVGTQEASAEASPLFRRADLYLLREPDVLAGTPPGATTPGPAWVALLGLAGAALTLGKRK